MVIQHNLATMNTNRILGTISRKQTKASEKLSSGYQINRAADDAAGLAISEKMRYQIRGLNQGAENIEQGVGYCQVADGALSEVHDMLQRITELSVQAANGTNSVEDRDAINQEINHIKEEMNRICSTTKFNEEYIFAGPEIEEYIPPYDVSFSGIFNDDIIYVYNDTFEKDANTGEITTTYGGIAYEGKRYGWDSINPDMYDDTTNTFREGTYSFITDDGASITLTCEDGSEPPQVTREFVISADASGIHINKQTIAWEELKTADGTAFDKNMFAYEPYYFDYCGVTVSFTPEDIDIFDDVVARINGTKFKSTYNLPTEETAVFANFSNTQAAFSSNAEVETYLVNGTLPQTSYKLRADEDKVWIEDTTTNSVLTNSVKTWEDLGLKEWGDQSKDVWADKLYSYIYEQIPGSSIGFDFRLINETSKDSVIDAFDGVVFAGMPGSLDHKNHAEMTSTISGTNIVSAEMVQDNTNITLQEEYELGREFSSVSDEFGNGQLSYDITSNEFSITYTGPADRDIDGNGTTEKKYVADATSVLDDVKNQIQADLAAYQDIILERYQAGAKNPTDINLTSLIGTTSITGGGQDTYFEEVHSFNSSEYKNTLGNTGTTEYASAKIDFSGLGTQYQLADLIGMGFNSTCQTCSNHYSIQFVVPDNMPDTTAWQSVEIDGETYKFYKASQGNDYTLYIDIESMQDTGLYTGADAGTQFTNTFLDIIEASNYDFHFTQYATKKDDAILYVFDNRPEYAGTNGSLATKASFSPYAYAMNSIVDVTLNLNDTNNNGIELKYQYDYNDLFNPGNITVKYKESADGTGKYVDLNSDPTNPNYVLYDENDPAHANLTHYDVESIEFTGDIEKYIEETIFDDIADSTTVQLKGDHLKYNLSATVNNNSAMVTTFQTPVQIELEHEEKREDFGFLRIQCSSNTRDNLLMKREYLSVNRMGLQRLDVSTQAKATRSIALADRALEKVSSIRSRYGAYQNRLEHAYASNRNTAENTTAAESRIRDTDMAKQMVEFSKNSILIQAGQAMLAQGKQNPQGVLALLQ